MTSNESSLYLIRGTLTGTDGIRFVISQKRHIWTGFELVLCTSHQ